MDRRLELEAVLLYSSPVIGSKIGNIILHLWIVEAVMLCSSLARRTKSLLNSWAYNIIGGNTKKEWNRYFDVDKPKKELNRYFDFDKPKKELNMYFDFDKPWEPQRPLCTWDSGRCSREFAKLSTSPSSDKVWMYVFVSLCGGVFLCMFVSLCLFYLCVCFLCSSISICVFVGWSISVCMDYGWLCVCIMPRVYVCFLNFED